MPQAGTVYRFFRADASKDISADVFELSTDAVNWVASGVTYVPPGSWPPEVIAANTEFPVKPGYVGYWWQTLTGPGTSFPVISNGMKMHGRATDSPEIPHFAWTIYVTTSE